MHPREPVEILNMQHAFKDLMRMASKGQKLSQVLKPYVTHHTECPPRALQSSLYLSIIQKSPTDVTTI